MEEHDLPPTDTLRYLEIQGVGGSGRTVEAGARVVNELLEIARTHRRQPQPISELRLAVQCGGSDGFSTISANPALGAAVDMLIANGGSAILSESSETFGAEHLLQARARSAKEAEAIGRLMDWWQAYAKRWGGTLDSNPTPGNAAGGITTVIEKSLGSVSKGGHSPLEDVIQYSEPLRARGLTFMDSPANDPVSVTGQIASGATVVAFTTGRGSVFGCRPVPSLKLATNSKLFAHMEGDMDLNCGRVIDGDVGIAEMGVEILDAVIDTASGKLTKSESLGFGDEEMVPWVMGMV
jgi:altronate hydrolase